MKVGHSVRMKATDLPLKRLTFGRRNGTAKKNAKLQDERMKINEEDLDLKWKGTFVILEKKRKNRKKETNGRLTIEDCGSGTSRKYFLL